VAEHLPHATCVYCLEETPGKCDGGCHPERSCLTITQVTISYLLYRIRQAQPLVDPDE
jgi:hypothetical protein